MTVCRHSAAGIEPVTAAVPSRSAKRERTMSIASCVSFRFASRRAESKRGAFDRQ
jgi:hypothetical protein